MRRPFPSERPAPCTAWSRSAASGFDVLRLRTLDDFRELNAFAGPAGDLFADGQRLFSADEHGLSVWVVKAGAQTARLNDFRPIRQHRASRELVELPGSTVVRWRH